MTTPDDFNTFLGAYEKKIEEYNKRKQQFDDNFKQLVEGVMTDFIAGIKTCETDQQLAALAETTFGANAERALEILRQTSAILEKSHSDTAIQEMKNKLVFLLTKEAYPDLRKTNDVVVSTPLPVTVATSVPAPASKKTSWWNRILSRNESTTAVPFVGPQLPNGSVLPPSGGRKKSKRNRKQKSRKNRTLRK